MGKNLTTKVKTLLLPAMLIVATAFTAVGCGNKNPKVEGSGSAITTPEAPQETNTAENVDITLIQYEEKESEVDNVLGNGKHVILFTMIDKEGNETKLEIHTDKMILGEALQEHDLIEGEESEYGLYVKKVLGVLADYNEDQTYWAFYIDGEYATTGVDKTMIKDGATYLFKVEK